jgi:hypothetical protein
LPHKIKEAEQEVFLELVSEKTSAALVLFFRKKFLSFGRFKRVGFAFALK